MLHFRDFYPHEESYKMVMVLGYCFLVFPHITEEEFFDYIVQWTMNNWGTLKMPLNMSVNVVSDSTFYKYYDTAKENGLIIGE